ncbi:MAG: PAS-domain containing protein [Paracoccaceae bacterium]|nr:PAS-domain containing protein [Paracoccaceae bacterium]
MSFTLINPADPPERQVEKLRQIAEVLMRRVEQDTDASGAAYAQFQRAALLEEQVRDRTRDLERTLDLLNDSNARLERATRAAEAARQNLANAIETVQEGFALFDADDVLVMCNSRFGMHMLDIREGLKPGLTFHDYIDRVSRSRFLELPEGVTPEDWAARRRARHAERHVIFNVRMIWDRWVQVSEHRTGDGGTVILQTDVTEIIRMEREERSKLLDDQARMIRATLDHLAQGVAIFDADNRLIGWNQRLAALLALPLTRLRLGASFDYILERFRDEIAFGGGMTEAALRDWIATPAPRAPLRFEMRRGTETILDVFAEEMPGRGFVISLTDVTAERAAIAALAQTNETLEARVTARTLELEEALSRAERANATRARFVAAASHDLLQPLSAARLFLASLADSDIGPGPRQTVEKAENALVSVGQILEALLDISRLEAGRAEVQVQPVRLDPLLTQLRDEFAPLAAAKGLRLTILPALAEVESDPTYLRRILQNLIGNAIRYTETGRVLVGARRVPGGLRVEVHDTGPGIPVNEQANIFKEFHRLNARASAAEGMGLGLAIVERACALLGHRLTLRSQPGRGTCFALTLSGAPWTAAAEARPSGRKSVPPPQDRIALLVENDDALRLALGQLLEKWGLNVIDAATGEEALSLMEEIGIAPDVLLVDQHLGEGATGLATIGALRARYGALPARILTADRTPDLRSACAAEGVALMEKPVDPAALESYLSALWTR